MGWGGVSCGGVVGRGAMGGGVVGGGVTDRSAAGGVADVGVDVLRDRDGEETVADNVVGGMFKNGVMEAPENRRLGAVESWGTWT